MKPLYFTSLLFLFLCLAGCNQPNKKIAGNPSTISGVWQNVSLHVEIYTLKNSNIMEILDANEENWEEVLQIKPIRTHFLPDGSFISEYRNLQDSVFKKNTGKWSLSNDSLFLTLNGKSYRYAFKIKDSLATFSGYLDWDNDGQNDDYYFGVQRKLSAE